MAVTNIAEAPIRQGQGMPSRERLVGPRGLHVARSLGRLVTTQSLRVWACVPAAPIASEFCKRITLDEGAGNAGCTLHPRSRVQKCARNAHTSIQVQSEHSGIPCAMALRLMPRSPRRRIRLVTVAAGSMADRSGWIDVATDSLTPATGARTTRFCRTHQRRSSCALRPLTEDPPCNPKRARRCRVHRILSRVS